MIRCLISCAVGLVAACASETTSPAHPLVGSWDCSGNDLEPNGTFLLKFDPDRHVLMTWGATISRSSRVSDANTEVAGTYTVAGRDLSGKFVSATVQFRGDDGAVIPTPLPPEIARDLLELSDESINAVIRTIDASTLVIGNDPGDLISCKRR
jgi:hypothetical protein